jgi:hypothetical protein
MATAISSDAHQTEKRDREWSRHFENCRESRDSRRDFQETVCHKSLTFTMLKTMSTPWPSPSEPNHRGTWGFCLVSGSDSCSPLLSTILRRLRHCDGKRATCREHRAFKLSKPHPLAYSQRSNVFYRGNPPCVDTLGKNLLAYWLLLTSYG